MVKNNIKIKLFPAIKVIVSTTLIVILFNILKTSIIMSMIKTVNPFFILLSFFATVVSFFMQAKRTQSLLQSHSINLTLNKTFALNMKSMFFGILLPTNVGGDIAKLSLLPTKKHSLSTSIVILDRAIGLFALSAMGLIGVLAGLFYGLINQTIINFMFFVLFMIVGVLILLTNHNFLHVLSKKSYIYKPLGSFIDGLQTIVANKKVLLKSFFYSLFFYLFMILASILISFSLDLHVSPIIFAIFVPLLALASIIPITVSGLGVRELVSLYFFTTLGLSQEQAVMFSLIPFAYKVLLSLYGGALYLKNDILKNKLL